MDSRFIDCVPLMEYMDLLVDVTCCVLPNGSIGVTRRFIYCVPLMVDRSGVVDLSIVCH